MNNTLRVREIFPWCLEAVAHWKESENLLDLISSITKESHGNKNSFVLT